MAEHPLSHRISNPSELSDIDNYADGGGGYAEFDHREPLRPRESLVSLQSFCDDGRPTRSVSPYIPQTQTPTTWPTSFIGYAGASRNVYNKPLRRQYETIAEDEDFDLSVLATPS